MKLIGILLIFNTLILTIWWVCTDHSYKTWAFFVSLVAIFVGVYFTLQDRAIEITIKNVGTIKAAAEQAIVDAQAVADLRNRIESQSATVDLVAESATKAHKLIEELSKKNSTAEGKIDELESAGLVIHKTLADLQETAKFFSLVVAAQNDDRAAFDELVLWVNNKASPFWQHAADALVRIRTDFGGVIERGHMNVQWPEGTNPKQLSLVRLQQVYKNSVRIYKADIVQTVWRSDVIDKKDKMAFFVNILRNDESLGATFAAGKYFVNAVSDPDLTWSPFSIKPLLDWWDSNKDSIAQQD